MKGLRRAYSVAFGLLLAVLACISARTAVAERIEDLPQPTDYVSDYAHVLSPQAIARLDSLCAQLDHSKANAQVAVVTIRTLDGDDSADYATRLFEKMKIGRKGSDRGVLLLFAINDHRRSIKVGYGLEGILPDGKTGDIGRAMVPYLRANDFDSAVLLGVGEVAKIIAADAQVTLNSEPVAAPPPARAGPTLGQTILLIVVLVFFGGFVLLRFLLGLGFFGGWGGGPWLGGGGFGGGGGGGDSGGGGFGGFGGGETGGGGSDGSW